MYETKTGWVAEGGDDIGFRVNGEKPKGVYVYNGFVTVTLNDAGLEKAEPRSLEIAGDPKLLRELAACLEEVADNIEERRTGLPVRKKG